MPPLLPAALPRATAASDAQRIPSLAALDGPREPSLDRLARLAARAVRAPVALLLFFGERGAYLAGAGGLAPSPVRSWPLPEGVVAAAAEAEAVATGCFPAAEGGAFSQAWVGVPVRDRPGQRVGVLLALDTAPRTWTTEDVQALEEVALTLQPEFEARAAGVELGLATPLGPQRLGGTSEALAHLARTERSHLTALLDALADGVLLVGADGAVIHCNKAFLGLFGLLTARPLVGLASAEACALFRSQFVDPDRFEARVQELSLGRTASFREMLALGDGRVLERDYAPVWAGEQPLGQLWIYRDVTERERARSSLGRQRDSGPLSHLDELTGLQNRRGFIGLARAQLDEAVRDQRAMLVIFSDLDGLKQINDRFGHQAGDRALLEFATLLRATFRERDLVGRFGGDEFVVLVTDASGVGGAELVSRLTARVEEHNHRGRRDFAIAFSTGVATFDPAQPEPLEVLLSQADRRMYAHKRRRKDATGT